MIEKAKLKIQQEADILNSPIAKMLSNQISELILNDERAAKVLENTKTLAECKKTLDNFAKKNKSGSESCVSMSDAEKIIFKYFDFKIIGEAPKQEHKFINVLDLL